MGAYTNVTQSTRKTRYVLNLNRSANAPVIKAGVITANIIWKMANSSCGICCPSRGAEPTPRNPRNSRLPRNSLPEAKERLYAHSTQMRLTTDMATKLCITVLMTFLPRTSPP